MFFDNLFSLIYYIIYINNKYYIINNKTNKLHDEINYVIWGNINFPPKLVSLHLIYHLIMQ